MAVNINIPSQVKTYANLAAFPASGALKTIYIAEDTNKTYRWTGSVYVEVSASASGITIGTTAITSGTVGRVLFQGTGNVVQQSANLFWDDAANRFIIGGSTASNVRANTNEFNIQRDGLTVPTGGSQLMFNLVGNGQGMSITNQNGTTYRIGQFAVANVLTIGVSGNSTLNLFTSGNVGIGTTTDAGFKLDVNGTARVQTSSGTTFTSSNSGAGGIAASFSTPAGGSVQFQNGYIESAAVQFRISTNSTQPFVLMTQGTERMRLAPTTGNVLINTTTDAGFRLDVNGTARFSGNITATTIGFANTSRTITFDDAFAGLQYQGFGGHRFTIYNSSTALYQEMLTMVGNQSNLRIGINSATPNASAILDVVSTDKGFLPPRMTTTQKNAIASPAAGLVVYDTTLNKLCVYTTTWETVTSL